MRVINGKLRANTFLKGALPCCGVQAHRNSEKPKATTRRPLYLKRFMICRLHGIAGLWKGQVERKAVEINRMEEEVGFLRSSAP